MNRSSKIKQASSLEDPMIMFKLQNMVNRAPTSFNKDSTTAKVIGISQQIPFWGKRALREEVASGNGVTARCGGGDAQDFAAQIIGVG